MMKFFSITKKKAPKGENAALPQTADAEQGVFFREVDIEFLIHELKDPIAVIEAGVRTLLTRPERFGALTDKQERTLKRSLRSCRRAQEMLNHLLEIGRSQSGCFSACRFHPWKVVFEALSDALETASSDLYEQMALFPMPEDRIRFLEAEGIRMDMRPDLSAVEMEQDETKFRHIVGNLIKNALHHRRRQVEIRLAVEGQSLTVSVTDDGPGVDSEHHQIIFRRYTRLAECSLPTRAGHGLGLAGARILARCLGGDIRILSERGKGATFELSMPLFFQGACRPADEP